MSNSEVQYFFLPWLRRGLAASIQQDATGSRAMLDVQLQVGKRDQEEWPTKAIALYGPGDILGFDSRIIVRTEPRPNTGDFEPNYFPFIEFAEPDFPWRFTAKGKLASDTPALKPWIALIVLRTEEVLEKGGLIRSSGLDEEGHNPDAQISWIRVKTDSLPDLAEAGRWAHVQITACKDEFPDLNAIPEHHLASILERDPERVVSRLLCPRRLRPGVKYTAYVVPTFKLGKDAASSDRAEDGGSALDPAWSKGVNDDVTLPYYYQWEFRTGRRGDFEHLVRRLEPRALSDLGLRETDCSDPGYGLNEPDVLGFESALKSFDTQYTSWGHDSQGSQHHGDTFRVGLANLLNGDDDPTPKVVPPLYGRWHKAQEQVLPDSTNWFDELNLDPRHRWAAGLGAEVIRKQQEQLMASAWDQLGDIEAVNDILRRAQFAREVSTKAEARLAQLSSGDYLRMSAPTLGLVRSEPEGGVWVEKQIHDSPIRKAPLDPAYRRLGRKRGTLRKHQDPHDSTVEDVLERLNLPPENEQNIKAVSKAVPVRGVPTLRQIAANLAVKTQLRITSKPLQRQSLGEFYYLAEYQNPGGGDIEVTVTEEKERGWLMVNVVAQKEGKVILKGTPPEPSIAKNALTSALVRYRFILRVKNIKTGLKATQSFDVNVHSKKSSSTKAVAPGGKNVPLVYTAAANIIGQPGASTKVTEIFDEKQVAAALSKRMDVPSSTSKSQEYDETTSAVASALKGWLSPSKPKQAPADRPRIDDLKAIQGNIKAQLQPAKTIPAQAYRRFHRVDLEMRSVNVNEDLEATPMEPPALDLIAAAPEFPQPMWGALEELSQQYLLAGIEKVPQNTIAIMKTNRRFVEAFLCGLNHEFSRELLWREYPTDQRGTYFRQFWDKSDSFPQTQEMIEESLKDIPPLVQWHQPLGWNVHESGKQNTNEGSLVLLIRGDLLNKYPNTSLYLVLVRGAVGSHGEEFSVTEHLNPIFSVTAKPDITCIGFNLSAKDVVDDGWYLVLEERISETRFGLDEPAGRKIGKDFYDLSWDHFDDVTEDVYLDGKEPSSEDPNINTRLLNEWNKGAAVVASITMQSPVRITVSAKQMIPPIARISGQIVTEDGQAINGVTVSVAGKTAETNQEGQFNLDRLSFGKQTLTAQHPDYEQKQKNIVLFDSVLNEVRLKMTLLPGLIGGTVTDYLGRGLPGVRVFSATGQETTTQVPNGDYELTDIPVGRNNKLTVDYAGYRMQTRSVIIESRKKAEINFELIPATGTINVKVTDHRRNILDGARVSAGGKETLSMNSDGIYELIKVPIGEHTISVEHIGFEVKQKSVNVEDGKLYSFLLQLKPTTGSISGKVTGIKKVKLKGAVLYVGASRTKSDGDGQYILDNIKQGESIITVSHSGYETKDFPVKIKSGKTKKQDFNLSLLPGSVKVTVKIVSFVKGRPKLNAAVGARVTLENRSVTIGKSGSYLFNNIPAGSHKVTVSHAGCDSQSKKVKVSGGGLTESPLNFILKCSRSDPRPPNLKRKPP